MKNSALRIPGIPAALIAAFALAVSACHDTSRVTQAAIGVAPKSITPNTTITVTGTNAVITLVLDVNGDVGKIGSYTGRLHFDPTALAYVGEIDLADGALRASNPGVGEIRVAGASTTGVTVGKLAAFQFTVKNVAALQGVRFDLEEVHELSHADLQASVVHSTGPRILK